MDSFWVFFRLRIKPQILRGISDVDMSLFLYGERISMPICMAPVGVQAMANTMAEMASVQGTVSILFQQIGEGGESGGTVVTCRCDGVWKYDKNANPSYE